MVNKTYLAKDKEQLDVYCGAGNLFSAGTVFRQVMIREYYANLVRTCSRDDDDDCLEIYDVEGSTVIVSDNKVNIVSNDEDGLVSTKKSLEGVVRNFILEERDQNGS